MVDSQAPRPTEGISKIFNADYLFCQIDHSAFLTQLKVPPPLHPRQYIPAIIDQPTFSDDQSIDLFGIISYRF
jgi:hypothetical protein